jgi:hypothetical protein
MIWILMELVFISIGRYCKVNEWSVVGLAYESSTWYTLTDELSQRLVAGANTSEELEPDVVDPQFINVYEPYKLQTPSKLTGSLPMFWKIRTHKYRLRNERLPQY